MSSAARRRSASGSWQVQEGGAVHLAGAVTLKGTPDHQGGLVLGGRGAARRCTARGAASLVRRARSAALAPCPSRLTRSGALTGASRRKPRARTRAWSALVVGGLLGLLPRLAARSTALVGCSVSFFVDVRSAAQLAARPRIPKRPAQRAIQKHELREVYQRLR